jgi:hypothetical protein
MPSILHGVRKGASPWLHIEHVKKTPYESCVWHSIQQPGYVKLPTTYATRFVVGLITK